MTSKRRKGRNAKKKAREERARTEAEGVVRALEGAAWVGGYATEPAAQKTKDRKMIVGETFSPRPIIIGESTFSARMLITTTPAIDQHRSGHAELGQGQHNRGRHRQHEPYVGHEAQEEGQDPPKQRESPRPTRRAGRSHRRP